VQGAEQHLQQEAVLCRVLSNTSSRKQYCAGAEQHLQQEAVLCRVLRHLQQEADCAGC